MTEICLKQAPKGTCLFMKVVSAVVEIFTHSYKPRPFTLVGHGSEAQGVKDQDSGARRELEVPRRRGGVEAGLGGLPRVPDSEPTLGNSLGSQSVPDTACPGPAGGQAWTRGPRVWCLMLHEPRGPCSAAARSPPSPLLLRRTVMC